MGPQVLHYVGAVIRARKIISHVTNTAKLNAKPGASVGVKYSNSNGELSAVVTNR